MEIRQGWIRQTIDNLRHGRHKEAYALFVVGLVLVILGLVGVVSSKILLSAILLALTFLVFHTSAEQSHEKIALDEVLRSREDFERTRDSEDGSKTTAALGNNWQRWIATTAPNH